jgi:nitric oxide reductase NorE protein
MKENNLNHSNLFFPPGGMVIWIFAFAELVVFGFAAISFMYQRSFDLELFNSSRLELNQVLATINTLVLISSSFSVVKAVEAYEQKLKKRTGRYLYLSLSLGITFLFLKFIEYSEKADMNFVLGANTFFDYYWLLTGFHAMHVAIGVGVLLWLIYHVRNDIEFSELDMNFHTGANYWHLCDLIWIIIFPLLYLL